jgi:hypothetical protein
MALSSDIISRQEQIEELFQQLGSKLNKGQFDPGYWRNPEGREMFVWL